MSMSVINIIKYFSALNISFHDINSIYGFVIIIVIVSQLVSGIMLSFSLVPEPMLIPMVRDEEDLEDLYIDDFFWLHERGVDLIFVFTYIHLFRKLYLNVFEYEHESAWKSGVFSFMIFQVVVFLGLILCCTHLSEITLTIAANVMHSIFFYKTKVYWWLFTDKYLNTDTLLRLAYAHYISAFYLMYIALLHGIDMHYDWKNESFFDGLNTEMAWWDEGLANELGSTIDLFLIIFIISLFLYSEPEALSYEIFMWGDIGLLTDIRFYGVAPHWYFRPFMAWLIVCPYHYTGVFGLLLFFFVLFHQPTLHGSNDTGTYNKKNIIFFRNKLKKKLVYNSNYLNIELNFFYQLVYAFFIVCALYTSSFLPYGRFYNSLGGNIGMLLAYMFVFMYITFKIFRRPFYLNMIFYNNLIKINFLKNIKIA